MFGRKAEIRGAAGNRRGDIGAFALLDVDADVGMLRKNAASAFGKCSDSPEVVASNCTLARTPLA